MKMKKKVKNSDFYCFLKRFYFRSRTFLVPHQWYAVATYWLRFKKYLNLNNPQSFDEKLWWLKFNYHNPLLTKCADKWLVNDYIRDCGLEDIIIEKFAKFDTADEISLDKIPDNEFFLKCNHLSGGNMICEKKSFDMKNVRKRFGHWLKDNAYYYGFEWPYKNIRPCIVAEKVLHTSNPFGLIDYKFFCFHGEPKMVTLDIGVCNKDGSHAEDFMQNIYDMDFNPMGIQFHHNHYDYSLIEKPANFEYMKRCARVLSNPFPHCRVDLYNVDGKVYFGEITFYDGCGMNNYSSEVESLLGSWIHTELVDKIS